MAKRDCCWYCVYASSDPCQVMAAFAIGFPSRPTCANQPGHYGRPTPTPIGKVCPNYRPKPPDPKGEHVRQIILTNGMVAYVDAADYEEISRYTWHLASGGYAGRHEKRKLILMHRQIMNPPEGMEVDHIQRNRLDNTRAHLRVCTHWENSQNRTKIARAASRHHNVFYNKNRKKWVARIRPKGKWKQVGSFDNDEEAARAHDYAAILYLNDSARLNFPEEWPPERRAEVRAQRDAAEREGKNVGRKEGKNDKQQKADGPAHSRTAAQKDKASKRTPQDAKRTTKTPRAETQGRGGQKKEAKSKRTTRRTKSDQRQATKKKAKRRPPKA